MRVSIRLRNVGMSCCLETVLFRAGEKEGEERGRVLEFVAV
jgi:hypothetical protein